MVTKSHPFSVSTLIIWFVSGITLMERNPRELPFPISALSHCLKKRSSTLCSVLTKWSPCRNQEWTTTVFLYVSVFGQLRECAAEGFKKAHLVGRVLAKTLCSNRSTGVPQNTQHRSMKLWVRLEASLGLCCMHFVEATLPPPVQTGFTWHLIWCNRRLPWKGWPWSVLPLATCSCCFLWVISIDYGAAEQANGKITCQK